MKRKILIISILAFVYGLSFSQQPDCDTIYKPKMNESSARYIEEGGNFAQYLGNVLNCSPVGDTIQLKIVTLVIDTTGKAFLYNLEGYTIDCEYYIKKKIEKMPLWESAVRKGNKVCFEVKFPVLIKRNNQE